MNRVETFNEQRPLLFSIAYRMLGSAMDAEDIVQEAFVRWHRTSDAEVQSPKAYLSTIITRLCIDQLRSARVQREVYIGPWLPEPLVTEDMPDKNVELADSLSMAFLVLLESLSPTERAVFLLREVFDYDYEEIAKIVDKTEANCRQMVRRARQHITERRPRYEVSQEQRQEITRQFMQACINGDMDGLLTLLADDITSYSDGGGKVTAARIPIIGPEKVANFMLKIASKAPANYTIRFTEINGQPGVIGYLDGQPLNVMIFGVANGRVQTLHMVLNPDKLRKIPPLESRE